MNTLRQNATRQGSVRYPHVRVGDELPPLLLPPVTRATLALFAGASGDHNPIHLDIDVAHAAGMPDVFAQGMLPMAWLGRFLTLWAPQQQLREFMVRFSAITPVGARLHCSGTVAEKLEREGESLLRLDIAVTDEAGEVKLTGNALIALP
jgi:acyl dehydratase